MRTERGADTSAARRPTDPDGPHAKIYRDIAARLRDQLTGGTVGRAAPKIVIEA